MFYTLVDPVPYRRRRLLPAAAFAVATLLLTPALGAPAQEEPAESAPAVEATPAAPDPAPAAETPAPESLVGQIESRFEVLPTRDGLLLRPLAPDAAYRAVEIEGGEVAVDGELLDGEALDDRLGDAAEPVRRLAELGEGGRALLTGEGPAVPSPGVEAPEIEGPEIEAPAAPRPPRPPRPPRVGDAGQRVSFASSVTVDEDEVAEVAVAIGGNVRVDGEVESEAVAVGGSVRVNGHVGTEAVAVGGSVHLGPNAWVEGDVVSVGGRVVREEGSRVDGQVSEVSMVGGFFGPGSWDRRRDPSGWERAFSGRMHAMGEVFGGIVGLIVLILLVGLTTLVAREPVERVSAKATGDPWVSLLAGFLFEILFLPVLAAVVLVLLISVIGIPLLVLVPFALLLVALGFLLGIAGVARAVGRWLERRFEWKLQGAFLTATIGLVAIHIWSIFASGFDAIGGPLWIASAMFWIFGACVQFAAWTIGIGAVLLTRFGAGPRPAAGAAPPQLPPEGYAEGPPPAPAPPPAPPEPTPARSDSIFEPEKGAAPAEPVENEPAAEEEKAEPAFEPDEKDEKRK